MAGKGFTGGRKVKGDIYRGRFENIDWGKGKASEEDETEKAIKALGLTLADFDKPEEIPPSLQARA